MRTDAELQGEGHRIVSAAEGMEIAAGTVAGLCRAARTASQLVGRRAGGGLEVATGVIDDEPTVPLRMLAGWGLHRDHRFEWALDVATRGQYNRILYNWWTAVPGERLGSRVGRLVEEARDLGVEPVCELRRQVLGPRFSLGDHDAVRQLLDLYDQAVDRGFQAFGLLFDDTDLDPFDDEIGLLHRVVDHLSGRLGHEPEMWFCPRFYWFPGDLDYSWLPRAIGPPGEGQVDLTPILGSAEHRKAEQARERQQRYQELLAEQLPARTLVYLANWWGGTPASYSDELARGWTDRLGRSPAFWDNQQQNDYRLSVVVPTALDHRPAGFAEHLAAFALNSGVPLAAYAPASITAGAWAWNPHGYDPAAAFRAAVAELVGERAAGTAQAAIDAWGDLVADLVPPDAGAAYHWAGLRRAVADRTGGGVRARCQQVRRLLAQARQDVDPGAGPLGSQMLDELLRDTDRLLLELRLAEVAAGEHTDAARAEAAHVHALLRGLLAERLPPTDDLDDLLHGGAPDLREPGPGLSWFLHFHASALQNGAAHALAELGLPTA